MWKDQLKVLNLVNKESERKIKGNVEVEGTSEGVCVYVSLKLCYYE